MCDKLSPDNNGVDLYFSSYEDLEIHRLMIEDKQRTEAYRNAILKNKDLFKDKTVIDVGAGTGILSIFCAQAGARKVYAVEASDVAKIAEQIVKENELADIIEVLQCPIEEFKLSHKVDILVSEWMGFYLLHEAMLNSVIYARDTFLDKGGLIFPEECTLFAAPCELPAFNQYWDNVYGIKMKSFGKAYRKLFEGKPEIRLVEYDKLLRDGIEFYKFNLNTVSCSDLFKICKKQFVSCTRSGIYQGICLWFDVKFPSVNLESCVILSTKPSEPSTHWKQTLIVLPVEIKVESDDIVGWELILQRSLDNPRSYSILLTMLDPDEESHPIPCDCSRPKCLIIKTYLSQLPSDDDDDEDDFNKDCETNESDSLMQ